MTIPLSGLNCQTVWAPSCSMPSSSPTRSLGRSWMSLPINWERTILHQRPNHWSLGQNRMSALMRKSKECYLTILLTSSPSKSTKRTTMSFKRQSRNPRRLLKSSSCWRELDQREKKVANFSKRKVPLNLTSRQRGQWDWGHCLLETIWEKTKWKIQSKALRQMKDKNNMRRTLRLLCLRKLTETKQKQQRPCPMVSWIWGKFQLTMKLLKLPQKLRKYARRLKRLRRPRILRHYKRTPRLKRLRWSQILRPCKRTLMFKRLWLSMKTSRWRSLQKRRILKPNMRTPR